MKLSPPELELLGKFLNGESPEILLSLLSSLDWERVLRKPLSKVIQKLIEEKYLIIPELPILINYGFGLSTLKDFCREKGMKVSGKKEEVIQRLISNDEAGMRLKTEYINLYFCSDLGNKVVNEYRTKRKEERDTAEEYIKIALQNRDFRFAVEVMMEFEANQVFPRGMGIAYKEERIKNYLPILSGIFNETPKVLIEIPVQKLEAIRLVSGINYIWGNKDKKI